MGTMTFALEWPGYFHSEQQTGMYEEYCLGTSQPKNVLAAKNTIQWQALPDLEGRA